MLLFFRPHFGLGRLGRQQLVQVLDNLGLDLVLEGPQQEPQLGIQFKLILGHPQGAVHARALETHLILRLAFGVHTRHVKFLLHLLGPFKGDLASTGQAQGVFSKNVKVCHGAAPR